MATADQSRVRGKQEKLQAHRVSETEFTVYNPSRGTSYTVRLINGFWSCNCPWETRSSRIGEHQSCKHIIRVQDKTAKCATGCPDNEDVKPFKDTYLCKRCRYTERFNG